MCLALGIRRYLLAARHAGMSKSVPAVAGVSLLEARLRAIEVDAIIGAAFARHFMTVVLSMAGARVSTLSPDYLERLPKGKAVMHRASTSNGAPDRPGNRRRVSARAASLEDAPLKRLGMIRKRADRKRDEAGHANFFREPSGSIHRYLSSSSGLRNPASGRVRLSLCS